MPIGEFSDVLSMGGVDVASALGLVGEVTVRKVDGGVVAAEVSTRRDEEEGRDLPMVRESEDEETAMDGSALDGAEDGAVGEGEAVLKEGEEIRLVPSMGLLSLVEGMGRGIVDMETNDPPENGAVPVDMPISADEVAFVTGNGTDEISGPAVEEAKTVVRIVTRVVVVTSSFGSVEVELCTGEADGVLRLDDGLEGMALLPVPVGKATDAVSLPEGYGGWLNVDAGIMPEEAPVGPVGPAEEVELLMGKRPPVVVEDGGKMPVIPVGVSDGAVELAPVELLATTLDEVVPI